MCCGNSILQKGLPFFYLHKIFYTLHKKQGMDFKDKKSWLKPALFIFTTYSSLKYSSMLKHPLDPTEIEQLVLH
ncbi:hypothetical protein F6X79_11945 [Enterococcus faecium]|nr:hypothetical protein F6X79_11945 [Enterococcus faecium]